MRALLHSNSFMVLLCLLLIAARISGAHWHLCFDGNEPPQAMHVGDLDEHNGDNTGTHHDVDLKLVGDALAKNLGSGMDVMLITSFLLLWLFQFSARKAWRPPYRETLSLPLVFPSHAPPRAPPR
jgi:hypothetical protein